MCPLRALLAERVLAGLGLPLRHGERRERGTALLLLVVLRLRLLLLLVAAHLTLGHDAPPSLVDSNGAGIQARRRVGCKSHPPRSRDAGSPPAAVLGRLGMQGRPFLPPLPRPPRLRWRLVHHPFELH